MLRGVGWLDSSSVTAAIKLITYSLVLGVTRNSCEWGPVLLLIWNLARLRHLLYNHRSGTSHVSHWHLEMLIVFELYCPLMNYVHTTDCLLSVARSNDSSHYQVWSSHAQVNRLYMIFYTFLGSESKNQMTHILLLELVCPPLLSHLMGS